MLSAAQLDSLLSVLSEAESKTLDEVAIAFRKSFADHLFKAGWALSILLDDGPALTASIGFNHSGHIGHSVTRSSLSLLRLPQRLAALFILYDLYRHDPIQYLLMRVWQWQRQWQWQYHLIQL